MHRSQLDEISLAAHPTSATLPLLFLKILLNHSFLRAASHVVAALAVLQPDILNTFHSFS